MERANFQKNQPREFLDPVNGAKQDKVSRNSEKYKSVNFHTKTRVKCLKCDCVKMIVRIQKFQFTFLLAPQNRSISTKNSFLHRVDVLVEQGKQSTKPVSLWGYVYIEKNIIFEIALKTC